MKQYNVEMKLTTLSKWSPLKTFFAENKAQEYILSRFDVLVEGDNENIDSYDAEICYNVISNNYRIKEVV